VSLSNLGLDQVHKLKPCQNIKVCNINDLEICQFYIYEIQWIVLRWDVNYPAGSKYGTLRFLSRRFDTAMGCPPEPTLETVGCPGSPRIIPKSSEQPLEQVRRNDPESPFEKIRQSRLLPVGRVLGITAKLYCLGERARTACCSWIRCTLQGG
jgi:hypothetical protein